MATPLPVGTNHLALGERMMKWLETAKAEVISDIADPSTARQFLNEIHHLKRLNRSDPRALRPSSANSGESPLPPVRIVKIRTDTRLSVLNGAQTVLR